MNIHKYYSYSFIKVVLIMILTFMSKERVFAQDPQFSQFYAASMYLNPAFTGNTVQHRLSAIYRNQWPSISKAYVSYSFVYDHNVTDLNSGVGLIFTRDKAGTGGLRYSNIGGLYSYYFQVNKKLMIRFGTKFSYTLRNYDQNNLRFNDQIITGSPATIENLDEGTSYMDISAGGLAYTERYWVGIAFDHVNKPNQSLINQSTQLPIKSSIHGGYKFILEEAGTTSETGTFITAAANYKAQEKWDQLDLGAYYTKDVMTFGLWYRGIPFLKRYKPGYANNDAIILMAGVQPKGMKIGYSYDITISKLSANTAGSHEISIVYEFYKKRRRRKKFFVPCAKF